VDLTGIDASLNGPDAAEFAITTIPDGTLTYGASTILTVTFTPASTGDKSATLLIHSNDPDDNPFVVRLFSDTHLSQAEEWRRYYFGITDNSGSAADIGDPDGDGLINMVERAFNLDPLVSGRPILEPGGTFGLPKIILVHDTGGMRLRAEFIRRKVSGNPGLIYQPQATPAFTGWGDMSEVSVTSIDAVWEAVVADDLTGLGQARRFATVKVSAQ
jgi:hypothetical protein